MSSLRKRFILDTSVLLYDKTSIHSFPGNDVILPLQVIDEIDKFKEKPGVIGEAARYVNRFLDQLRQFGRLDEGIQISNDLDQRPNFQFQFFSFLLDFFRLFNSWDFHFF